MKSTTTLPGATPTLPPPHPHTPRTARSGRAIRRVYIALLVVAALAFDLLVVMVRQHDLRQVDIPIIQAVQSVHQPVYAWVLTQASQFGWFPGSIVAYLAVFAVLFALGLRLEAFLAVGSSLLADAADAAIKLAVGRLRPSAGLIQVVTQLDGYSFPSGHVLEYVTLFGFTAYVAIVAWRGWLRAAAVSAMLLLIVLVGLSRIYLGAHYPSDVLGAYLLGGLWLAATIQLRQLLRRRLGTAPVPRRGQRVPTGQS